LVGNLTGDLVVDLQKTSYIGYPTGLSSIVASNFPLLSGAIKNQDAVLSGWTTTITDGDDLRAILNAASGVTRATLSLRAAR